MIKRCKRCVHGINQLDTATGTLYTICTLTPPTPFTEDGKTLWVRPSMAALGWCGQFKLNFMKLFSSGPKA